MVVQHLPEIPLVILDNPEQNLFIENALIVNYYINILTACEKRLSSADPRQHTLFRAVVVRLGASVKSGKSWQPSLTPYHSMSKNSGYRNFYEFPYSREVCPKFWLTVKVQYSLPPAKTFSWLWLFCRSKSPRPHKHNKYTHIHLRAHAMHTDTIWGFCNLQHFFLIYSRACLFDIEIIIVFFVIIDLKNPIDWTQNSKMFNVAEKNPFQKLVYQMIFIFSFLATWQILIFKYKDVVIGKLIKNHKQTYEFLSTCISYPHFIKY